jgi:alanine racemase
MLASYQRQTQAALPAILHIDTGMNRLGYGKDTRSLLADKDSGLQEIELQLVMSHLACSDDPSDDCNRYQLEQFTQLIQPFAHIPKSLCNSGGIFLPSDYHFQLTRPGIALYGSMPDPATPDSPLRPVLSWQADIVQIRTLQTGERAGYGGEFIARTPTRLATIAAGYADGYARALYQPDRGQIATVEIAGKIVPLAGRVSMDVLIADVTSLTDAELETADHACLLGPHYSLTEMATDLDTISYEILTGLGDRPARLYDGA